MKKRIIFSMLIILNVQAAEQSARLESLTGACLLNDAEDFLRSIGKKQPTIFKVVGGNSIRINDQANVTSFFLYILKTEKGIKTLKIYKKLIRKKNDAISLAEKYDDDLQEQLFLEQQKKEERNRQEKKARRKELERQRTDRFRAFANLENIAARKSSYRPPLSHLKAKDALLEVLSDPDVRFTRGGTAQIIAAIPAAAESEV